jgi:hypothetical protein
MSSFLDQYGAGEERRNKLILRGVAAAILLVAVAIFGYYMLRNRGEAAKIARFRELLTAKDYAGAYVHWGCTAAKPCPYYPMDKFLEDWGPQSGHTDFAAMTPVRRVTCKDGYGQGWKFPTDTVHLWVVREDQSLSFDPWPNWRQTWLAAALNDCSGLTRTIPSVKPL